MQPNTSGVRPSSQLHNLSQSGDVLRACVSRVNLRQWFIGGSVMASHSGAEAAPCDKRKGSTAMITFHQMSRRAETGLLLHTAGAKCALGLAAPFSQPQSPCTAQTCRQGFVEVLGTHIVCVKKLWDKPRRWGPDCTVAQNQRASRSLRGIWKGGDTILLASPYSLKNSSSHLLMHACKAHTQCESQPL